MNFPISLLIHILYVTGWPMSVQPGKEPLLVRTISQNLHIVLHKLSYLCIDPNVSGQANFCLAREKKSRWVPSALLMNTVSWSVHIVHHKLSFLCMDLYVSSGRPKCVQPRKEPKVPSALMNTVFWSMYIVHHEPSCLCIDLQYMCHRQAHVCPT